MRRFYVLWLSLLLAAQASAAELEIFDSSGAPVSGAVIIVPTDTPNSTPSSLDWPDAMAQKDLQFSPYVLVAEVGSDVRFPNQDRVRHHVYSFSKGNKFELELYGKDETHSVQFDNPGVVAVGCNIHDEMIGYIRVVESAWVYRSDKNGRVDLPNTVSGPVLVWHPDLNDGEDYSVEMLAPNGTPDVRLPGRLSAYAQHHH